MYINLYFPGNFIPSNRVIIRPQTGTFKKGNIIKRISRESNRRSCRGLAETSKGGKSVFVSLSLTLDSSQLRCYIRWKKTFEFVACFWP